MTRLLSLALAAAMFLGVASVAAPSLAQDRPERVAYSVETSAPARASVQARETRQAPARAVAPRRAGSERLSPELQRALESGDMTQVARYLPGRRGAGGAATPLTIGIDPLAHTCNGGNCACAGVEDCVQMVDDEICKPDTIGCNSNGFACEEADPPANPD